MINIGRLFLTIILIFQFQLVLLGQRYVLDPNKSISQYTLKRWSGEDGLPSIALTDILQTEDKYLWVSTYNGLAKFDGVSFEVFNLENTPAMLSNSITTLAYHNGVLWIGSHKGIVRYENNQFSIEDELTQLHAVSIEKIFFDSQGGMWIGTTSEGLFYYKDRLVSFHDKALMESPIKTIIEDATGGVWAGTDKGSLFYLKNVKVKKRIPASNTSGVTNFYLDKSGTVWVGAEQGLFNIVDGELIRNEQLDFKDVVDITEDEFGNMWFSNNHGVFRYFPSKNKIERFSEKQGLPNNLIRKLLFDHQGNLWIASYRSGLFQLTDGLFTCYSSSEGLRGDVVTSVIQYDADTYWLGLEGGKIDVLHQGEIAPLNTSVPIPSARLKHLMRDREGYVWVSTYGGLLKFDKFGTAMPIPAVKGMDNYIRLTFEDTQGNIWIGTRRVGVFCLKPDGTQLHFDTNNGLGSNFVMSIDESDDGKLYVGTKSGLEVIENEKVIRSYDMSNGLPTNMVFDVFLDQETIWIATDLGLCRVRDNQVIIFNPGVGLSDNVIFDVVAGNDQALWLSSNTGVIRVPKAELDHFKNGCTKMTSSRLFDKGDGMKSEQCVGAAKMFTDEEGRIWIPTISGIATLNPAKLSLNQDVPVPFIEKIKTDEQQYFPSNPIAIQAGGAKHLQISFTAFNYIAPSKIDFQYRLFPFDDKWRNADDLSREVSYTNLPPDNYTFEVRAGNNGVWNEQVARLEFEVAPYFYETKWFYLSCFIAFVGLTYFAYSIRIQSAKRNEHLLQQRVTERTEEILQQKEQIEKQKLNLEQALTELKEAQSHLIRSEKLALLGQLTASVAHEINTPLGAIKSSIRSVNAYMADTITTLPALLRSLSEVEMACFALLLQEGNKSYQHLPTKERRALRTELAAELKSIGIDRPRKVADNLVDYHVNGRLVEFLPILTHEKSSELLVALGKLHNIMRGTNNISIAAEKAAKTIFALKTYAHIDHQKKKTPISIATGIEMVLTLYSSQIKQGVKVKKEMDDLPLLYCFPDELSQVWTNLIHNALHAMGNKGKLGIKIKNLGHQAVVEISDSGDGIPPEIQDKIFQPFFTTKEAGEGSGLGLDIVKKIVDNHQGDITFESEKGKGSTFKVTLPIRLQNEA
ncbi:MAG: two-component regulator propeller domain-containing protein [Flammeovirgaceae bacterium]